MKTKKTILTMAATILFAASSMATVLTISNHPLGGAQYSSLQAGFDAAVNGDTLLIEGTDILYNFTTCQQWNKQLVVIGAGFNPQKTNPLRTKFGNISCYGYVLALSSLGNGSKFYGIEFMTGPYVRSIHCIDNTSNYVFEDCKIIGLFTFNNYAVSNFIFTNCIFDYDNNICLNLVGSTTTVVSNILIQNCVFDGKIEGANNPYLTAIIDHCVFFNGGFSNLSSAIISNNIFMNTFPSGTTNCTYTNNICNVAGTFPPSGNSGVGNIDATDPNLVSYTPSSYYSTTHDYHLQTGSAAIGAALDATDIGVHGGTSGFSEQGEVLINPIMRLVTINNPNIAPNGTINVQINATKPDND